MKKNRKIIRISLNAFKENLMSIEDVELEIIEALDDSYLSGMVVGTYIGVFLIGALSLILK